MFIEIEDATFSKVWVNTESISALLIPSPLAPGDGKPMLFVQGVGVQLTRVEATRVAGVLKAASETIATC